MPEKGRETPAPSGYAGFTREGRVEAVKAIGRFAA
jgi:hypothetical protein